MLSVHTLMQEAHGRGARRSSRRLSRSAERQALDEAILQLPEIPRLALGLRHLEGLRPRQIAAVLGVDEEEARRLLAEASREVLSYLERNLPQPSSAPARRAGSKRRACRS